MEHHRRRLEKVEELLARPLSRNMVEDVTIFDELKGALASRSVHIGLR